jgi:hypothetical protein
MEGMTFDRAVLRKQADEHRCRCRDSLKMCCSQCFDLFPARSLAQRSLQTWDSMPLLLCPKCANLLNEWAV